MLLHTVEHFEAANCGLTAADCNNIAANIKAGSSKKSQLRVLNLSGNDLKKEGISAITRALQTPGNKLSVLDVCSCQLGCGGAVALKKLLLSKDCCLAKLYVFDNKLGVEGATNLAESLAKNSSLTVLDLGCNRIRTKGTMAIADSLFANPLSQIRTLCLKANFMEDKAYEHFQMKLEAAEKTELTELLVGSNQLSLYTLKKGRELLEEKKKEVCVDAFRRIKNNNEATVFISGLKKHHTVAFITKYFEDAKCGVIRNVDIGVGHPVKGKNGPNKFAFVQFAHKNSIAHCIKELKNFK